MKRALLFLIYIFLISELSDFSQPTLAQWQKQMSGTTEDLNDVDLLNQTTAVIVGDNGTILKTTDNGLNWVAKNSGATNHLNAISFCDDENGITVGDQVICRTTDGGESWSLYNFEKNATTLSYRYHLSFRILIGCADGTIISSTNDGNTWIDTTFSEEPIISSDFNNSWQFELAYIATRSFTASNIFPSYLWTFYQNPVNIWDIITGGDLKYWYQYLVGTGGNPGPIPLLLRKQWNDTLWVSTYSFVPPPFIPQDITNWSDILFVCGSDGKIFNSKDGGDDWVEQFTGTNEDLLSISFLNDSIGYSVGKNGTILFTSNGGVSDVEDEQKPLGFYLSQNYPNPFNPTTKIEFRIADFGFVSLKVFDVLGKEVATLVDSEKSAGTYEVEFNARDLSDGVYFYQLKAGSYIETKKMILVK